MLTGNTRTAKAELVNSLRKEQEESSTCRKKQSIVREEQEIIRQQDKEEPLKTHITAAKVVGSVPKKVEFKIARLKLRT